MECRNCDKEFEKVHDLQTFCSTKCRNEYKEKKRNIWTGDNPLYRGRKSAMSNYTKVKISKYSDKKLLYQFGYSLTKLERVKEELEKRGLMENEGNEH